MFQSRISLLASCDTPHEYIVRPNNLKSIKKYLLMTPSDKIMVPTELAVWGGGLQEPPLEAGAVDGGDGAPARTRTDEPFSWLTAEANPTDIIWRTCRWQAGYFFNCRWWTLDINISYSCLIKVIQIIYWSTKLEHSVVSVIQRSCSLSYYLNVLLSYLINMTN